MPDILLNASPEELLKAEQLMDKLNLTKEQLSSLNLPLSLILVLPEDEIIQRLGLNTTPKEEEVKPKRVKKKPVENTVNTTPKEEISTKNIDFESLVSNLDLNNIKINNSISWMEASNLYTDFKKARTPIYEVTLPISGYNAKMKGLTIAEIDFLRNSIHASGKELRKAIIDIVYSAIVDTGIPNFSKDAYLKNTALLDHECLVYGILKTTYGSISEYNIQCTNCNKSFDHKLITDSIIAKSETNTLSNIMNTIFTTENKTEAIKNSVLHTFHPRHALKQSGLILELEFCNIAKETRLYNKLEAVVDDVKSQTVLAILLWVKRLFIPIVQNNEVSYFPLDSETEIFKKLHDATIDDLDQCLEYIDGIKNEYSIKFRIPEVTCKHCSHKIESLPVDISQTFFLKVVGI